MQSAYKSDSFRIEGKTPLGKIITTVTYKSKWKHIKTVIDSEPFEILTGPIVKLIGTLLNTNEPKPSLEIFALNANQDSSEMLTVLVIVPSMLMFL